MRRTEAKARLSATTVVVDSSTRRPDASRVTRHACARLPRLARDAHARAHERLHSAAPSSPMQQPCATCAARGARAPGRFTLCDVAALAAAEAEADAAAASSTTTASAAPSLSAADGPAASLAPPPPPPPPLLPPAPPPGPARVPRLWIAARGGVFAVPREWATRGHPGGLQSIFSHAGTLCDADFDFHSVRARARWARFREGDLDACAHPQSPSPRACAVS